MKRNEIGRLRLSSNQNFSLFWSFPHKENENIETPVSTHNAMLTDINKIIFPVNFVCGNHCKLTEHALLAAMWLNKLN